MSQQNDLHQQYTILIADDSPTQRAKLDYLLKNHGYQVLSAKNGLEALEIAKNAQPQLVITDIIMPEMDGLTLCKTIKTTEALKHIPVMLMTALTGVEEIGRGLEVAADNFIYKPYDDQRLLSHVEKIISNKSLRRLEQKQMGVQITLGGKNYRVNPDGEQILDLLVSSIEDAVYMNELLQGREAELKMAKEAAEVSNFKKGKFLATMSHEIRTPMTSILGLVELLNLTNLDKDQHNTLVTLYESGKSLLRIIDDILDFSKIEAGKLTIAPTVSSIPEIIKRIHNLYSGAASKKSLTITSFCSPDIAPAVVVDALRLQQILGNFTGNAIKFTDQGIIDIRAELVEQTDDEVRVRFSVKDTGIGISKENQTNLFQPFVQVSDSSMRNFTGTGLGLVICQRLAELMDGEVTLESELGAGTTISVELSLPKADPSELMKTNGEKPLQELTHTLSQRRSAPDLNTAEKENTLVLIVDDHPANRHVLLRQLNILGYAAEGVESGADALAAINKKQYAMMITDCNMPIMDGYELTHQVRKLESENNLKRLPIIAFTANAMSHVNAECLAAGMDDCLIKPAALKNLLDLMDQWLPLPSSDPIDRACLINIVGDDETAQREIMLDFKRTYEADSALLIAAVKKNDMTESMNLAHRIKGASLIVGAKAISTLCQHIEDASRLKNAELLKKLMTNYKKEVKNLDRYFKSL